MPTFSAVQGAPPSCSSESTADSHCKVRCSAFGHLGLRQKWTAWRERAQKWRICPVHHTGAQPSQLVLTDPRAAFKQPARSGKGEVFQPHPPQNINNRLKIEARKMRSDRGRKKKPNILPMLVISFLIEALEEVEQPLSSGVFKNRLVQTRHR